MIVSIHQPAYLPWLGYFHKLALSDVFVVLDKTQFEKNSFINRNKIKTAQGWMWLTVPVETAGKFKNNMLTETKIINRVPWAKKHWKSIELNYSKAPFFNEYADEIKEFYKKEWTYLTDLCYEMLKYFVKTLGITTTLVLSSEMKNVEGFKTDLVINICKELGATTYISGVMGRDYLNEEKFRNENIKLVYQNYKHPRYTQLFGKFEPYMSIIDLLFNYGPESLNIIMATQETVEE